MIRVLGLPDFLVRMRQASKDYQQYKQSITDTSASDAGHFPFGEISDEQVKDKFSNDNDNDNSVRDYKDQRDNSADTGNKAHPIHDVQQKSDTTERESRDDASSESKDEQDSMHYLYLTKLFAFLNL